MTFRKDMVKAGFVRNGSVQMYVDCGSCGWSRPCTVRLRCRRWLAMVHDGDVCPEWRLPRRAKP